MKLRKGCFDEPLSGCLVMKSGVDELRFTCKHQNITINESRVMED